MLFFQEQDCPNYKIYNGSKPRGLILSSKKGLCNAQIMQSNWQTAIRNQVRANDMRPGSRVFKLILRQDGQWRIVPSLSISSCLNSLQIQKQRKFPREACQIRYTTAYGTSKSCLVLVYVSRNNFFVLSSSCAFWLYSYRHT